MKKFFDNNVIKYLNNINSLYLLYKFLILMNFYWKQYQKLLRVLLLNIFYYKVLLIENKKERKKKKRKKKEKEKKKGIITYY